MSQNQLRYTAGYSMAYGKLFQKDSVIRFLDANAIRNGHHPDFIRGWNQALYDYQNAIKQIKEVI